MLHASVRAGDEALVQVVARAIRGAWAEVPISNADVRRVVVGGAVRVNGRVVTRPGARLQPGDQVAVAADPSRFGRARRPVTGAVPILYRDPHVIAVDKPAGLPTHATADPKRAHLVGLLARQLGIKPSGLGVHQRLDAGTSGVVLFGLTAAANRGLARVFESHAAEKVYLAVADGRGRPDLSARDVWTARGTLAASGSGRGGRRMAVADAGRHAETVFRVRSRRRDRLVIEARPKTGRQHQIRAHLAAERLPIVGDTRYGGPRAPRVHLHAWRLRLAHPVTGEPLAIEAPPPRGWLAGT